MDIIDMWDGWRWRYSRQAELHAMVGAVIANRIPFQGEDAEVVQPMELLERLREYREDKG